MSLEAAGSGLIGVRHDLDTLQVLDAVVVKEFVVDSLVFVLFLVFEIGDGLEVGRRHSPSCDRVQVCIHGEVGIF